MKLNFLIFILGQTGDAEEVLSRCLEVAKIQMEETDLDLILDEVTMDFEAVIFEKQFSWALPHCFVKQL